jgi:hypothetical protein
MNQLILVIVFVVYVYFGGKYVPNLLKQNKGILLGFGGGLVLCSFFGVQFEGFANAEECKTALGNTTCTLSNLPGADRKDGDFALCDYISWSGMQGWLWDNPTTRGHLQPSSSGDSLLCPHLRRTAVHQYADCVAYGSTFDQRSSCGTRDGRDVFDTVNAAHRAREMVRGAQAAGAAVSGEGGGRGGRWATQPAHSDGH